MDGDIEMSMFKAYSALTSRAAKIVDCLIILLTFGCCMLCITMTAAEDILIGFMASIVLSLDAYVYLYMDYLKFNGIVARKNRTMIMVRTSWYGKEMVTRALKLDSIFTAVMCLMIGYGSSFMFYSIFQDMKVILFMGFGEALMFYIVITLERWIARKFELTMQTAMFPMMIAGFVFSFTSIPFQILQDTLVGNTKGLIIEAVIEGCVLIVAVIITILALKSYAIGYDCAQHDINISKEK